MNPHHEINSWQPMSTDDQALPPPIIVQAYLVVDGDSDQPGDHHQLPPIMVKALPVDDSNQCIFRTVSMEFALPDGTVMIHTEKLAVYPDGSVQVLESRDDVQQQQESPVLHPPNRPNVDSTHASLPIRVQTSAVPAWNDGPSAALPVRIRTAAVPRGFLGRHPPSATTVLENGHVPIRIQTSALPSWSQPSAAASPSFQK
jgi:hypothetical protein